MLFSDDALRDLAQIEADDGRAAMRMLFQWCRRLDEPSVRLEAQRLGEGLYRLRVDAYYIAFHLIESHSGDSVCIRRIRNRWASYRR